MLLAKCDVNSGSSEFTIQYLDSCHSDNTPRTVARFLQGNMPKRRQLVVKDAYERLCSYFGGSVSMDDIRRVRNALCTYALLTLEEWR